MSDAARIADKYVARDGGPPTPARSRRADPMSTPQTSRHILTLASFVAWHDKGAVWGGYTKEQAFDSLCALTGLPRDTLLRIVRDDVERK